MEEPITSKERAEILKRYLEALRSQAQASDANDDEARNRAKAAAQQWTRTYYERLPRIAVGSCPFDGKPLMRTFDPFGFDGLWWNSSAVPPEPPKCPHFCVLRGAVHFQGLKPRGGGFEVRTGPEVPYVIPRILAMPTMQAVVARTLMTEGYSVYFISYFAERRPPVQELTADWPRKIYEYETDLGVKGWNYPNDVWDFDLLPWALQGKLRWCPPESDNLKLSTDPPEQCPYLDLPGVRRPFFIKEDKVWTRGLPDGTEIHPYHMD